MNAEGFDEMKKYRLGIIGCGRISNNHIKALIENSDKIELVSCCDVIRQKALERADEYLLGMNFLGFPKPDIFLDYKEMIALSDLDIVSICTESGYHAEIANYCMNKGKHVIVEKPMALSKLDAEEMINISKINRVKLCISHQNRFNPSIQQLRVAIETGKFGRIIAANARILWNRGADYYSQATWRGTYELDGGCLMNQCIHNIDLLQWMLGGEIKWVHGTVNNFIHPYIEAEDYGSIQIMFENGAIGNVEGTVCVFPKNLEETLTIIGEKGTVVIGGLAVNKIETWKFGEDKDLEEEVKKKCNQEIQSVYGSGHTPLYRDVIDAIENDRQPLIDGESGKKAMEIILAAYSSSRSCKRINFPIANISSKDFRLGGEVCSL